MKKLSRVHIEREVMKLEGISVRDWLGMVYLWPQDCYLWLTLIKDGNWFRFLLHGMKKFQRGCVCFLLSLV